MPAFTTHYLYGVDLYKNVMKQDSKELIHKHIGPYRIGLQGPDLFFYNPICMIQSSAHNIGSRMHELRTSQFFRNYLELLKPLQKQQQQIAASYLCGLIAHYTLDSSIHPYVYERTGYTPDSKQSQSSLFGKHAEIETHIDTILLKQMMQRKPSQFHASRTIHLTVKESRVIASVMSRALAMTYSDLDCPCTGSIGIQFSVLCTKLATTLLHTRCGKRKAVLQQLERRFLPYSLVSSLMATDHLIDDIDAMNLKETPWRNPWKPELISYDTVLERYQKAKQHYKSILPLLHDYLNSSEDQTQQKIKPLLKELGNYSYHSGLQII